MLIQKLTNLIGRSLLKWRGEHHWHFLRVGLIIGGCSTLVVFFLEDPNKDGNFQFAFWTGPIPIFVAIIGNLWANYFQKQLDKMPRRSVKLALSNHNLAALVGESIYLLLLLQAEGTHTEYQLSPVSIEGKSTLKKLSLYAKEFWGNLIKNGTAEQLTEYSGLLEPTLSKFIIDANAHALNPQSWTNLLNELCEYTQYQEQDIYIKLDSRDLSAIATMLENEFGRAFRQALKNDFVDEGLGWAAMQLDMAGQILMRTQSLGEKSSVIAGATAKVSDRYYALMDDLARIAENRHENMMTVLLEQGTDIEKLLISQQAQSVQLGEVHEKLIEIKAAVDSLGKNTAREILPEIAKLVESVRLGNIRGISFAFIGSVFGLSIFSIIGIVFVHNQLSEKQSIIDGSYIGIGSLEQVSANRPFNSNTNLTPPWKIEGVLLLAGPSPKTSEVGLILRSADQSDDFKPIDLTSQLDRNVVSNTQIVEFHVPELPSRILICLTRPHPRLGTEYRVDQEFKLEMVTPASDSITRVFFTPTASPKVEANPVRKCGQF